MCFLTGEDLLCRSVWSERSAAKGLATATARCRHGEEMLSCSSFSQNGARAGERVEVISKECLFRLLKNKKVKIIFAHQCNFLSDRREMGRKSVLLSMVMEGKVCSL